MRPASALHRGAPRARPHRRVRRSCAVTAALLLSMALAGCQGSSDDGSAPAKSPAPRTTSPEEICFDLVSYWAKQELRGGQNSGSGFMQKGLSNGQNTILLAAVEAGRAEQQRHGTTAAEKLMERQVERGCERRYRNGTPTEGIWQ
ncbi:hypothetical protein [Streptomyces triticagri]|nr:hypothetical protein [Streptomyces triticagri]